MKLLRALSIPKLITACLVLALGVNGLVQVGLQRDMAAKAAKLKVQLAQTEQLSAEMKTGLAPLTELRNTSEHMAATLESLSVTTAYMNDGLGRLEHTVGGIGDAILTIDGSTQAASEQVLQANQTSQQLLELMQSIYGANGDVIASLNVMIRNQKKINDNLKQMNEKTALLPQWGGNK